MADHWDVSDGEPLEGALHHWVLTPKTPSWWREPVLPLFIRDEFWDVLQALKSRHRLTYWCMGSRSWEGGAVHVVVGDPQAATKVAFEMGAPDG